MSFSRTSEDWLRDIVEWGAKIERYIGTRSYEEFAKDHLLQDAVIRCIAVVGEAANQLMRDKSVTPDILAQLDLKGAYAARNKLVHGYFGTEPQLVWAAATGSVSKLSAQASALLASRESDRSDD